MKGWAMENELDYFLKKAYDKWGERNYLFEKKSGSFVPITFKEFIDKVGYFSRYLLDKGYEGKFIGIYGKNSVNWMLCDVAIMGYVGSSVGLSKDLSYENLYYCIKKAELSLLIYDEEKETVVEKLKKDFPDINFLCMQKELEGCILEGKKNDSGLTPMPRGNKLPAKVVFTSGTTSFPKAVLLSTQNIFSGWRALAKRVPFGEKDRCYLFLPLNHTYGAIYNFLYSLIFGFEIYLCGNLSEMAQEMMQTKPTIFSGVPIIYERLYAGALAAGISLKTLMGGEMKYLFCGGARLSKELRESYVREGMLMMNAYGLSETSSTFCIDYPGETDLESVGTLDEYIDAKVIDPDEEGYGELAAKGDCIFLGYLKDEEATRAAFNEDGYFLTGDIGCIRNNKVYIKGRKDAKIVLPNGEKVLVKEIEGRVKSLNENVVTVKPYVRNNQLHVDIYVKDESLTCNVKLWEKLIEEFNNKATKYERIGSFEVKNSAGLLK